ncbi:MAG: leucine-rich repeat protein, partial [Oscillospiraceae bacterium]|nr:leucine-rich repeat protein [Oscillospiraceae bacterium]
MKKTADSTDRVTCKVVWIAYGAFAGNKFITKVTIPPQVEEVFAESFKGCTALESVEFTNIRYLVPNTTATKDRLLSTRTMDPTVKLIGNGAFMGCSALTNITIPDSVTTLGQQAFEKCSLTGTVTIPPAVKNWDYGIFSGCTGITGFVGPTAEENPKLFVEDGMILVPWGDGGRGVLQAPAGAEYNNVPEDATAILTDAFSGCDSESATIGENVSEIYERAFYQAFIGTVTFSGCAKKLQYNAITETRFNNLIIKCDTLTEAEGYSPTSYSTFGTVAFTPEVTQIAPMFFGYDRGSGYTAEDDLEAMSTVTVLRFNADKVDGVLNGTFAGVQEVLIGSNVAKIPYGLCAAHRENATRLSYVEIPNGVKIIDNMAFFRCSKLNALKLPDSLEEIRYAAFASSGLTSVYVPGNVTTLGPEAFADMKSLEWVAVPNNFNIEVGAESSMRSCGIGKDYETLNSITMPMEADHTVTVYGADDSAAEEYCTELVGVNAKFTDVTDLADTYYEFAGSVDSMDQMCIYDYTGEALTPALTYVRYALTPEQATQYRVAYQNNTEPGFADVTVSTRVPENGVGIGTPQFLIRDKNCAESGNHVWSEWIENTPATCLEDGEKSHKCLFCGKSETQTIPAEGHHTWGEWTVTAEATCSAEGSRTHVCTLCGEAESEIIEKLAHTWSETATVVSPTFTADGYSYHTCTVCGEEGEHFDIVEKYDSEVQNAQVTKVTPTSATITWDAVNTGCVHLALVTNGYSFTSADLQDGATSYTMEGLNPGQEYLAAIWVSAVDSEGNVTKSPKHTELSFATPLPAIEAFKTESTGYTDAKLVWDLPEGVTSVDLLFCKGVVPADESDQYSDAILYTNEEDVFKDLKDTSCSFTNLIPGTTYTAFVMPHTDSKDKSNVPMTKLVFATSRLAVSDLTVTEKTTSKLTVTWTMPAADGYTTGLYLFDSLPEEMSVPDIMTEVSMLQMTGSTQEEMLDTIRDDYGDAAAEFVKSLLTDPPAPVKTSDGTYTWEDLAEDTLYTVLAFPVNSLTDAVTQPDTGQQLQAATLGKPVIRNVTVKDSDYRSATLTWEMPETPVEAVSLMLYRNISAFSTGEDVAFAPEDFADAVNFESVYKLKGASYTSDDLRPDTLYTAVLTATYDDGKAAVTTYQFKTPAFDLQVSDLTAVCPDRTSLKTTFTRPEGDVCVMLFLLDSADVPDPEKLTYEAMLEKGNLKDSAYLSDGETSYTFALPSVMPEQYLVAAFVVPLFDGMIISDPVKPAVCAVAAVPAAEATTAETTTTTKSTATQTTTKTTTTTIGSTTRQTTTKPTTSTTESTTQQTTTKPATSTTESTTKQTTTKPTTSTTESTTKQTSTQPTTSTTESTTKQTTTQDTTSTTESTTLLTTTQNTTTTTESTT